MILERIYQAAIWLERFCRPLSRFARQHWLVTTVVIAALYQVLVWFGFAPPIVRTKWIHVIAANGLALASIVGAIIFIVLFFLPRERQWWAVEGQVVASIRELNKMLLGVAKTMTGGHFDDQELRSNRVAKRRIDKVVEGSASAQIMAAEASALTTLSESQQVVDSKPDLIPRARRTAADANRFAEFLHPDIIERLSRIERCEPQGDDLQTIGTHADLVELFLATRLELEELLDKHHASKASVLSDRIKRQTEQGQITAQRWPARRLLSSDEFRWSGAAALVLSFQREGRFDAARWVADKYVRADELEDLALELKKHGVSMPQNKPGTTPPLIQASR